MLITPKTKIYDLLEAYPELEEVLIGMVPTFKKLKNPVLRRTIARVTTLQQAARVGEIGIEEIINKFRAVVGQENIGETTPADSTSDQKPDWFKPDLIVKSFDATEVINSGGHPMNTVLGESREIKTGEIYELLTPFVPAPLIDAMKNKGFECWSVKKGKEKFSSYFLKK